MSRSKVNWIPVISDAKLIPILNKVLKTEKVKAMISATRNICTVTFLVYDAVKKVTNQTNSHQSFLRPIL